MELGLSVKHVVECGGFLAVCVGVSKHVAPKWKDCAFSFQSTNAMFVPTFSHVRAMPQKEFGRNWPRKEPA